jgi:demethylmenaquinone methyltransferase/2-methoxy-6-polyprenyl-1,4-benzoquinol methylase
MTDRMGVPVVDEHCPGHGGELRLGGVPGTRTELARGLFAPLGPTYDRYANVLSFGQDPRWRRFVVARVPVGPDDTVLDVACGTGAVVLELLRQRGCSVVGVDQSPEMLDEARDRIALAAETRRVRLVEASAEQLPFDDASFDGLTAAYLLRYLDDLPAGLRELARVLAGLARRRPLPRRQHP